MSTATAKLAASAPDRSEPRPTAPRPGTEHLDWLVRHIAANQFLPVPPPGLHNVGDGDWRAIGAEFLGYFVKLGGVEPHHAVLELGCGTGRMAVPLTQYLDRQKGSYDGFDIVAPGIAWCRQAITPAYPRFRFHHMDVQNDLYNPGGKIAAEALRLSFREAQFDFAVLTSLLTHLGPAAIAAYAAEVARLLRPGARCFVSLFLIDEIARDAKRAPGRRLVFEPAEEGPAFYADRAHPLAAVGYEPDYLIGVFAERGLKLAAPVAWGHWRGRPGLTYQDLCVFAKSEANQP